MSKPPEWLGVMKANGEFVADSPRAWMAYRRALGNTRVVATLKRWRKKASRKQHGWYRGYALPTLAKELGYMPYELDAVHDALMRKLVGLKPDSDPRLQIRASSADLDMGEFNESLIEQLQVMAAMEFGIVLADPDPEWKKERRHAA